MYLYDTYGKQLDYGAYSNGGDYSTIEKSLSKGTYYIQIDPYYWDGISSSNYRLTTTFPDKTPTINSVSNLSATITGSAEVKARVYAYSGSKLLGSTTAVSGISTLLK